jgi:hypothetical protein
MQREHVGTHAIGQPVIDRPDLEIDGLDAAESALHQAEGFVAAHGSRVVENGGGQADTHDVEAVECRFHGDFIGLSGEAEPGVGNVEGEVLGHLLVEHGTDLEADFSFAAQRLALAVNGGGNASEVVRHVVPWIAIYRRISCRLSLGFIRR